MSSFVCPICESDMEGLHWLAWHLGNPSQTKGIKGHGLGVWVVSNGWSRWKCCCGWLSKAGRDSEHYENVHELDDIDRWPPLVSLVEHILPDFQHHLAVARLRSMA